MTCKSDPNYTPIYKVLRKRFEDQISVTCERKEIVSSYWLFSINSRTS